MMELIGAGRNPQERWRHQIVEGSVVWLGRLPRAGPEIPWDPLLSREHASLELEGDRVRVRRLPTARNSIFFEGKPNDDFLLSPGDQFRIGSTVFQLLVRQLDAEPRSPPTPEHGTDAKVAVSASASANEPDVEELAFLPDELQKLAFGDADQRLEILSRLPQCISQSQDDGEFAAALVEMLLEAIPQAEAVAVAEYELEYARPAPGIEANSRSTKAQVLITADPKMMRWNSRSDVGRFRPSRRLIAHTFERNQSILHVWTGGEKESAQFTISSGLDWAFCTPIPGEGGQGWCLYVSGKLETISASTITPQELEGHLRFTQLMAQFIGAVRQVRSLEHRHTTMSQFFSPRVMETLLRGESETALRPHEGPVSVMFCDVRGFSKEVEQSEHRLLNFLSRVSEALGVMTGAVMNHEGVIADFQGDAVLAFWGWPSPLEDGPLAACRAALAIHAEFALARRQPDHPLKGFTIGIGIGHGRAIAGKIGTEQQSKVGVFGSVVNLASRLEGMTKQFGVTILMDETTAEFVRNRLPSSEGRCRKIARVLPKGMKAAVTVSELLLPARLDATISDQQLSDHEASVEAFIAGRWNDALKILKRLPPEDRAKDILLQTIQQHGGTPPSNWTGVIELQEK